MIMFLISVLFPVAWAGQVSDSCDPRKQKIRSAEMQKIYAADQKDRALLMMTPGKPWSTEQIKAIARRDLARRKSVAGIFAEGCLASSADFAAAAMIYQHGTVPEHYFQAYVWAQRAVELGNKKQNQMVAMAIDRFLVSTGKQQLFATQAFRENSTNEGCWCLQPIAAEFSDERRAETTGRTTAQALDWVKSLNSGSTCVTKICETPLKVTARGSLPGIW